MTKNQNSIIPAEVETRARQDASKLHALAMRIEVTTPAQEEKAYEGLTEIKGALRVIETERKKITAPLNQSLKAANKMFKILSEPFKAADSIIRCKIMDFRQEQMEKAEKEQARRKAIQTSHEERGHKTYDLEEVAPEVAEDTVTAKIWKIKVINIANIPVPILRHFATIEEDALTKYLRMRLRTSERDGNGKPLIEIAGTKVYQEEGLRV